MNKVPTITAIALAVLLTITGYADDLHKAQAKAFAEKRAELMEALKAVAHLPDGPEKTLIKNALYSGVILANWGMELSEEYRHYRVMNPPKSSDVNPIKEAMDRKRALDAERENEERTGDKGPRERRELIESIKRNAGK